MLFAKAISYEAIAREMGTTKNAVIGKLQRLDLHRGLDRVRTPYRSDVPRQIGTGCLYIAGDPKVVWKGHDPFCNAKRREGSPYCNEHSDLCYRPLPEKLKRLDRLIG